MKSLPCTLSIVGLTGMLALACTESSFSGGSSGKSDSSDSGETGGGQTDVTPDTAQNPNGDPSDPSNSGSNGGDDACVKGDKVQLQYKGDVKKCIDEGKLYNFDAGTCTAMRQASFNCDFDTFFTQLERIGLQPSKLLTNGRNGIYVDASGTETPRKALIMGCGESADKQTILLQWFFQPEQSKTACDFDPTKSAGQIITGCYGKDSGPANVSEAEKMKIVLACMNGL